jgi:hypothetical protein
MKSNMKVTLDNRRMTQPHNANNIYFMLERQKLIHEMGGLCGKAAVQHHQQISHDLARYESLTLPDLPPPYLNLHLLLKWSVPEKNSKQSTQKHMDVSNFILMSPSLQVLDECIVLKACSSFASSMTVISFAQLARTVAEKSVDKETKDYCIEVALILKERHTEMTKVGKMGRLSTIDSVSQGPKEEAKPRNADSKTKDSELTEFKVEYCLPTMDSISPGPKNDTKQRKVQLPRRLTHAFEDQPS